MTKTDPPRHMQERVARAYELNGQDVKVRRIAAELSVHPETVRSWLRKYTDPREKAS